MDDFKKEIYLWRDRIDEIDLELVKLLNERTKCAEEIGKIKLLLGLDAYSPEREEEVKRNLLQQTVARFLRKPFNDSLNALSMSPEVLNVLQ